MPILNSSHIDWLMGSASTFLLLVLNSCKFFPQLSNRNLDSIGLLFWNQAYWVFFFFCLNGSFTSWQLEQSQALPAAGGAEFLFSACSLICSQLWEPCKHKKQRRIGGFNGSWGFEYSSVLTTIFTDCWEEKFNLLDDAQSK